MDQISEMQVERVLRAVLAERRDHTGASRELRRRVLLVPDIVSAAGPMDRVRRARSLTALAGIGAAAAILALVFTFGSLSVDPPSTGVGASPGPEVTAPVFDPTVEGPGIIQRDLVDAAGAHPLSWLPWAVAIGPVLALGVMALRRARVVRLVAVGAMVTLAAGAFGWSTHRGLELGFGWGAVLGLDVRVDATTDSGKEVWYVTAEPREPIGIVLVLRNPGPLPVAMHGVGEDADPVVPGPRWTAVWIYEGTQGEVPAADRSTPFREVVVAPGDSLVVYLMGHASRCALGPGFVASDVDDGSLSVREDVSVTYSVLGLRSESEISLPFVVAEPQACPREAAVLIGRAGF